MLKTPPQVISLTSEETELLSNITFGSTKNHEVLRASCGVAKKLAKLLLNREAVPQIRIDYFINPDLNVGSRKSRKEVFESNGTSGEDILSHAHFLPYLRYFIFGPELPAQVITVFCTHCYSNSYVSGSDVDVLKKLAKSSTREHKLNPQYAAKEFFKLALECGMHVQDAKSIQDTVRVMRN